MPTYDYLCDACGHEFERFQSISSSPLRTCPQCGRRKLKRQIGPGSGIIFKGSGFHATDYRSGEYQKKAAEESKGAGGGKPEKKSEAPKSGDASPPARKSASSGEDS